jgi:hypothetical protein
LDKNEASGNEMSEMGGKLSRLVEFIGCQKVFFVCECIFTFCHSLLLLADMLRTSYLMGKVIATQCQSEGRPLKGVLEDHMYLIVFEDVFDVEKIFCVKWMNYESTPSNEAHDIILFRMKTDGIVRITYIIEVF